MWAPPLWRNSREISNPGFLADRGPNAFWTIFLWCVKKVLKSQRKVIFRFLCALLNKTITNKKKTPYKFTKDEKSNLTEFPGVF